jgi:tetratricopeptide (TPR) repeat protein
MKIRFFMVALLALFSIAAFAQKGELNNANEQYQKYDALKSTLSLARPALMNAKTSIDKASVHEKTAALPLTSALKAAIYASLAVMDTVASTSATEYATALESLKKAKQLDTKNENTKLIDHANIQLAQYQLNKGVVEFQNKKFDEAYKSFDAARQIIPEDTTAILNTAIAAINAKNYAAGIANYNKLVTTNYSDKVHTYNDLSTLYLVNKDTAGAIKSIGEAVAKYPSNAELRKKEIEISLQAGQQNDLITKIEAAIKNDPKNKNLYYYEGLTYSQIAESASAELKKIQKTATKAAQAKPGTKQATDPRVAKLEQTKLENFNKAAEMYKKAIELDANYFEAVLNLGYVYIAPAIDNYNAAQFINDNKAYNDAMAKVKMRLDQAKPYLLKAVELNPKSVDALTNLKSYYLANKDTQNANDVQKKIDALGGK